MTVTLNRLSPSHLSPVMSGWKETRSSLWSLLLLILVTAQSSGFSVDMWGLRTLLWHPRRGGSLRLFGGGDTPSVTGEASAGPGGEAASPGLNGDTFAGRGSGSILAGRSDGVLPSRAGRAAVCSRHGSKRHCKWLMTPSF